MHSHSLTNKSATFYLQITDKGGRKFSRPLARKSVMVIGSDAGCEWQISRALSAPRLLVVHEESGKFFITPLQPDLRMAGESLAIKHKYLLKPGQPIIAGSLQIALSDKATEEESRGLNTFSTQQTNPLTSLLRQKPEADRTPLPGWLLSSSTVFSFLLLGLCFFLFTRDVPSVPVMATSQKVTIIEAPPLPKQHLTERTPPANLSGHEIPEGSLKKTVSTSAEEFLLIEPASKQPYGLASTKNRQSRYDATIQSAARLNDLDPALLKAVIHAESGFDPFAVSSAGAEGLMQIMPSTAEEISLKDAFHPGNNILKGSKLLKRLLTKYNQNEELALAAYNAGEGAIAKYGGIPPFPETEAYVEKVKELRIHYRIEQAMGSITDEKPPLR